MSALSAAVQRRYRIVKSHVQNYRVANAVTIYMGSFCGLPGTSGFTSTRGYARPWSNVATLEWIGVAFGSGTNDLSVTSTVVGDTSASPVVEVSCAGGQIILEQHAVTGVSAQADVGKVVY